ncbi:MAG: hypothetical protein ACTSW4_02210 [Candidatus Ranarchaeia archaeon]
MNKYYFVARGVALVIFFYLFTVIYGRLSVDVWDLQIISETFTRYYWIGGYFIGLALELFMSAALPGITFILGEMLGIPVVPDNVFISNVTSFLRTMWRYPTELPPDLLQLLGSVTTLFGPVQVVSLYMIQPIVYSLFPIMLIITIVAVMIYAATGAPRFGIISFAALHGMVAVASIQIPELFTRATSLGYEAIPATITEFYSTQIFQVAIISYFFLESVYISDYLRQMLDPQTTAEKRFLQQYRRLKEEAEKPIETTGESHVITGSHFSRLHGSASFTFIREILEKRLFRKKSIDEQLGSSQDVRRLNVYLSQLQRKNPKAIDTLTARSALPSMAQILSPTFLGTILRAVALVFLSFFVIQPTVILSALNVPPPILDSIEALTPEMSLFILLPLATGFALISTVIRYFIERTLETQVGAEKILAETTSGTQVSKREVIDAKKRASDG